MPVMSLSRRDDGEGCNEASAGQDVGEGYNATGEGGVSDTSQILLAMNDGAREDVHSAEVTDSVRVESEQKETLYGWVVVAAAFYGRVVFAFTNIHGMFLIVLLDHFGRSRTETALLGAVCNCCGYFSGPIVGGLINQFGHRVVCIAGGVMICAGYAITSFSEDMKILYFSYGLMTGFGLGCVSVSSSVIPNFYFVKKRKIAMGVVVAGAGVGQLVLPVIVQFCIDKYGWQGAMLISGGVALQVCISGALYRPVTSTKQCPRIAANSKLRLPRLVNNLTFWLILISTFCFSFQNFTFFTYFPDKVSVSFSAQTAALLLCISGISSTVIRIVAGVVTYYANWDFSFIFGIVYASFCVPHFILIFNGLPFAFLCISSILHGLTLGIAAFARPIYVVHVFGLKKLATVMGLLFVAEGAGNLVGSVVGGTLIDATGSYHAAFGVTSALSLLGGLAQIPVCVRARKGLQGKKIVVDDDFQ